MIDIIPNWHPIFVHFTVALLSASAGFFLFATVFPGHRWREQWLSAAFWNLWGGGAASILTIAAGWYAFNTVTHDTPSHEAMTEHRNWALITAAVLLPVVVWSVRIYTRRQRVGAMFLGAMLLVGGLLLTTAWHGAELVYRHGLGVMSLPKPDATADGHGHGHDDLSRAAGSVDDTDDRDTMEAEMASEDAMTGHDDHDDDSPGVVDTAPPASVRKDHEEDDHDH